MQLGLQWKIIHPTDRGSKKHAEKPITKQQIDHVEREKNKIDVRKITKLSDSEANEKHLSEAKLATSKSMTI